MTSSRADRIYRDRRSCVAALLAALALAVLGASPAAAANNITIHAEFGGHGFIGANAGSRKTIHIEWRDSEGNIKSKHKVESRRNGEFISKSEPDEIVESGDVFTTRIGTNLANVREFTVPKLTVAVDRDTDSVTGKVQTNDLASLLIRVTEFNGRFDPIFSTDRVSSPSFTPDSGVQSYSTSSWSTPPDIQGLDLVSATWSNARGDRFEYDLFAEGVVVTIRRPLLNIYGNPGDLVSVDLNAAPSGALRAEADTRIGINTLGLFGRADASFTDVDGEPVSPAVGNEIVASIASDATFLIPNITATFKKAADDVIVDCNVKETGDTGVSVSVRNRELTKSGSRADVQHNSGGGTYLADFTSIPPVDIVAGDKVIVSCKLDSGDVVNRQFTVP